MTITTDAAILRRAASTPEAFEAFVIRHHAAIHRYVSRRLGPNSADDVVNEVFAAAYVARGKYDQNRPDARPWLYGIATNMIRRHTRTEARLLDAYARNGAHPEMPTPSDDGDLGPHLAAALAAMRKPHRDVFLLHVLADLTYEEIALAMEVPIGTVRGWISRARATAAQELAARGVLPRPSSEPDVDPEVIEP